MDQINRSKTLSIIAIAIITIIFSAIISPLKGLGILTPVLILLGIGFWIMSLIFLIAGLKSTKKGNSRKKTPLLTIILLIGFIPIGVSYIIISGYVMTKITVNISNHSDYIPANIMIYGTGNIFENPDTLKVDKFAKGDKIEYAIRPSTKPHRKGYIRIEFDIENKHISKDIAGEFSINPYQMLQNWTITLDNEFFR